MSQVLAMYQEIDSLKAQVSRLQQPDADSREAPSPPSSPFLSFVDSRPSDPPAKVLCDLTATDPLSEEALRDGPSYLSTSAVQEPVSSIQNTVPSGTSIGTADSTIMSAKQLRYWETVAYQICAALAHLPTPTVTHLLKTHWSWVHPTFMFISRPIFLRDAAVGGPHFSTLLLSVICLHSTRFTERGMKDELLARVRLMLGQTLHMEPSVPTVQALLQFSAREIGRGSLSRGWLYSGMAFRMAVDMGIFSRAPIGSDWEKQKVREQLAWSCYLWDKAISLYLGRAPVLPNPPSFDPPRLDELAENDDWTPHFDKGNRQKLPKSIKSHIMSCFANFCKLSIIVSDVLLTMYSNKIPSEPLPFVQETKQRLERWRLGTPTHLLVQRSATISPPPNILTQNLLYHATIILLHRPFNKSTYCRSICRDAAESVEHILLLYESTFGFSFVTYMQSYCAYIAATVAVMDLHDGLDGSRAKVGTFVRALCAAGPSCPGIRKSVDIIIGSCGNTQIPGSDGQGLVGLGSTVPQSEPLPAFPFDEQNDFYQLDTWQTDPMADLPFGGLDSFALEWSKIPMDAFDNFSMYPQD